MRNTFYAAFLTDWQISETSAAKQSTLLKQAVKNVFSKSFNTFQENVVAVKKRSYFSGRIFADITVKYNCVNTCTTFTHGPEK